MALLLVAWMPVPGEAAPSIAVDAAAAMNGTNFGLRVDLDAAAGQAVVISQHPQSEQSFTVSFWVNPNAVTLCAGINCRLVIFRAFGNRQPPGPLNPGGVAQDAFRVIMRRTAGGAYLLNVWVRDFNSPNPGWWEQVSQFFFGNPNKATKITVEWVAATTDVSSDGSVRVLKDDVESANVTSIHNPLEVDNARMGHVFGAVAAGATGSIYLDEYVSSR